MLTSDESSVILKKGLSGIAVVVVVVVVLAVELFVDKFSIDESIFVFDEEDDDGMDDADDEDEEDDDDSVNDDVSGSLIRYMDEIGVQNAI